VIRLARAGYGSPEELLNTRADIVIAMILYEKFVDDYQRAYYELNKAQ
jgi:hypothetical protein